MGRVVPVLHVREGELVARRGGRWEPVDVPRLRLPGLEAAGEGRAGLVDLAAKLAKARGEVCVVDTRGLEGNDPDLALAAELDKRRVEAWWDAGPRSLDDALDLLVSGAGKVTLRWGRLRGADIAAALDLAESPLFVGLEATARGFAAPRHEALDALHEPVRHAAGLVVIDLDAAGSARGFHAERLEPVKGWGLPLYAAGGVASAAEAGRLFEAGAEGVLVSTALLRGEPFP